MSLRLSNDKANSRKSPADVQRWEGSVCAPWTITLDEGQHACVLCPWDTYVANHDDGEGLIS